MSKKKQFKDGYEEEKTYVDGQPREIKSKKDEEKVRNPLTWVIPIMIVILLIPLLTFHIGGGGEGGEADDSVASEEDSGDGGEEGGEAGDEEEGDDSSEEASSEDVDAESVARDNCASCHGDDFSGEMGPALDGTDLEEDEFQDIVREGQGSMPAFDEDEVSDDELTALYDFFSE